MLCNTVHVYLYIQTAWLEQSNCLRSSKTSHLRMLFICFKQDLPIIHYEGAQSCVVGMFGGMR